MLNKGEIKSLRIQRWLDRMSCFSFEVRFKQGKEIPHVDCLSRNCGKPKERDMVCEVTRMEEHKVLNEQDLVKLDKTLMHRGIQSMEYELKRRGYNMRDVKQKIKKIVKECEICKMYNAKKGKKFVFVTAHEPNQGKKSPWI